MVRGNHRAEVLGEGGQPGAVDAGKRRRQIPLPFPQSQTERGQLQAECGDVHGRAQGQRLMELGQRLQRQQRRGCQRRAGVDAFRVGSPNGFRLKAHSRQPSLS